MGSLRSGCGGAGRPRRCVGRTSPPRKSEARVKLDEKRLTTAIIIMDEGAWSLKIFDCQFEVNESHTI